jgi:hypothetical protein
MSLINEALKKVQSQTPGSPLSGPPSGAPTPPPAEPIKFRGWLTLVLSAMVVFLMFALIIVLLSAVWSDDGAEEMAATTRPALPHSAALPLEDSASELAPLVYRSVEDDLIEEKAEIARSAQKTIAPVEVDPQPPASLPQPNESLQVVEGTPPRESTVIVQQSRFTQPSASAPAPTPAESAAIQEFIDALDIRGVMSAGQRLLIHNQQSGRTQAYQAGSLIDEKLNLSLLKVEDRLITFTTNDGQIYTKRF